MLLPGMVFERSPCSRTRTWRYAGVDPMAVWANLHCEILVDDARSWPRPTSSSGPGSPMPKKDPDYGSCSTAP